MLDQIRGAAAQSLPAAPARDTVAAPAARLAAIDTLRVLLTALVIAHHAGQAYGPTGGRWPVFNAERAAILGPFFAVNAAFFMGLFFLLAGFFTPGAYDRKGALGFLRDRLLRLGLPFAVITLGMFGLLAYLGSDRTLSFPAFLRDVYIGQGQYEVGHLWFVLHLLVYAGAYWLWRLATARRVPVAGWQPGLPGQRTIVGYMLILAGATALVRIWYPIDRWERVLGLIPAEIAHVPQYASLFVIGVIAARGGWLERMPARVGLGWLLIGACAGAARYAYSLTGGWPLPGLLAGGGAGWPTMIWSLWEALICVGLCIGLPVFLREYASRPGALLRVLAPNAYGAYLIHIVPVVVLQQALAGSTLPPLAKFAGVVVAAVPASFLIVAAIRAIPGLRRAV